MNSSLLQTLGARISNSSSAGAFIQWKVSLDRCVISQLRTKHWFDVNVDSHFDRIIKGMNHEILVATRIWVSDDPEGKIAPLGASSKHYTPASLPLRSLWQTNHNPDLSTQTCYRLLVRPQPLFKYHEAKKNLVIVVPPRRMLLEQFADSLRTKVLIDPGTTI
jgi:hypothetical protein